MAFPARSAFRPPNRAESSAVAGRIRQWLRPVRAASKRKPGSPERIASARPRPRLSRRTAGGTHGIREPVLERGNRPDVQGAVPNRGCVITLPARSAFRLPTRASPGSYCAVLMFRLATRSPVSLSERDSIWVTAQRTAAPAPPARAEDQFSLPFARVRRPRPFPSSAGPAPYGNHPFGARRKTKRFFLTSLNKV